MKPDNIKQLEILVGGEFYFSATIETGNGVVEIYHVHDLPYSGCVTYVTSGLKSNKEDEILMHCRQGEADKCLGAIKLLTFNIKDAQININYGTTLGGEDVIPFIPSKTAFYFAEPIYYELLLDSNYIWALPVSGSELSYILNSGPESFNDILNESDALDLISVNRESAC